MQTRSSFPLELSAARTGRYKEQIDPMRPLMDYRTRDKHQHQLHWPARSGLSPHSKMCSNSNGGGGSGRPLGSESSSHYWRRGQVSKASWANYESNKIVFAPVHSRPSCEHTDTVGKDDQKKFLIFRKFQCYVKFKISEFLIWEISLIYSTQHYNDLNVCLWIRWSLNLARIY